MKIKEGFVLEKIGDSTLVVSADREKNGFDGLIRLNGTGVFLWNRLSEKDVSRTDLLEALLAAYDVDEAIAERDVDAFLANLRAGGLLV